MQRHAQKINALLNYHSRPPDKDLEHCQDPRSSLPVPSQSPSTSLLFRGNQHPDF